MPQVNGVNFRALAQFVLLISALPAQYLITRYSSSNQHQTAKAIKELVEYSREVLSWQSWQKWCYGLLQTFQTSMTTNHWSGAQPITDTTGECPAVEVMYDESPDGYFADVGRLVLVKPSGLEAMEGKWTSVGGTCIGATGLVTPQTHQFALHYYVGDPYERSPRPKYVQYRVGQVITHKIHGYKGIIIGWDPKSRAPQEWLDANHPKSKKHWKGQPNYAILVDTRDRAEPQITYVPQENIRPTKEVIRVEHPSIDDFFVGFDGRQYIPRPALRKLYPDD